MVQGVALLGAFPALTTLARQYSPFPSVAFQKPGCSAAAIMDPKGRAGTFMSYHCLRRMEVSGISIQMRITWAFSLLAFKSPMEKSVVPVGKTSFPRTSHPLSLD